jgi:hypothetical protein
MKILRIVLYIFGGLFIALLGLFGYFLIFVDPYMENAQPGVSTSWTVGGKTVHVVTNGAPTYKSTIESGQIVVNDKKFELPDGTEFTLTINEDGSSSLRPGKP